MAQTVKHLPPMREPRVRSLGQEDPLEKDMAIHSSTISWKIPWTERLVGYSPWGRKESDTTVRLHSLTHSPALGDARESAFLPQDSIPCRLNDRAEISSSQGLYSCDPVCVWSKHLCMGLAFLKAEISNRIKDLSSQFSGQLS